MFSARNRLLVLFTLFLILLAFAAHLLAVTKKNEVEYFNPNLGFRVLIPEYLHINDNPAYCEGAQFYERESSENDSYNGFSISICVNRNTIIQNREQPQGPYGNKQPDLIMVGGIPTVHYSVNGMIGVQESLLLEHKGDVYVITYWLPPQQNRGYYFYNYEKEKNKADRFIQSFKFVESSENKDSLDN